MQREILDNQQFGEWTVIKYAGDRKQLCRCSCGTIKEVDTSSLKSGRSSNCGNKAKHPSSKSSSTDKLFKDLTNKHFGVLTVNKYVGNSRWKCTCICGKEVVLLSKNIRNHKHEKCTHINNSTANVAEQTKQAKRKDTLLNSNVGDLEIIEKVSDDRYMCRCVCGLEKEVRGYSLRRTLKQGKGYECNHVDILNRRFGKLKVIKRLPNQICRCLCECGNTKDVWIGNLLNNSTTSCGCLKSRKYSKDETLQIINKYIEETGEKPFYSDLSELLGLGLTAVYEYIDEYNLKPYLNQQFGSKAEKDIWLFVTSMTDAIHHDRKVLNGLELDIYIPNKSVAIEFNESYWHSYPNKEKDYHQQKTLACAQKGIRLIHIFEYEWADKEIQEKLKQIIRSSISNNSNILYARNLSIYEPSIEEAKDFENKYHLQGYTSDSIRIGLKYNDTLVGIMTFGKPRFNNNYEYELIRLCYINDTTIVGGAERILKYFLNKYNPNNIITYVDISKFTGNSYLKLGFKPTNNPITKPNYVWVDSHNHKLSRYMTMKSKLVEHGLGTIEQTEDEIMINNNYFKVYDSGNIRLSYINKKTEE